MAKITNKTGFQVTSHITITMNDAKFIDNLLNYKLPKNIKNMFIDILNHTGYWDFKNRKHEKIHI